MVYPMIKGLYEIVTVNYIYILTISILLIILSITISKIVKDEVVSNVFRKIFKYITVGIIAISAVILFYNHFDFDSLFKSTRSGLPITWHVM